MHSAALVSLKFTVYHGTIVHTPDLGTKDVHVGARIGVDPTGTIVFVHLNKTTQSPLDEALAFDKTLTPDDICVVDISSHGLFQFFVPGFIDSHIHAPQYPNCGVFGSSTLFDWLFKYTYPVERQLKDPEIAKEVYEKVVRKTLENGTTCCAYYSTIHVEATNILADCAYQQGQRAMIGRSCQDCGKSDYKDEDADAAMAANLEVIKHVHSIDNDFSLIKPILTPRNANKCTEDLMFDMARASNKWNIPIQAHMSETEDEVELILKMYTHCNTYAEVYDYYNLLTEQTILGHCIYISNDEIDLINERKAGVAHCPISNSCLTSGEAHVRKLLDKDTKVGLGTDVSGGYSPSILTTARHAVLVSRHIAMKTKNDADKLLVNEALYLATLGGARVCGYEDKLGSFEVGKKWECQLISVEDDVSPFHAFGFLSPDVEGFLRGNQEDVQKFQDIIDKWVFNGDDRNVRRVYVNGRCVVRK